MQKRACSAQHTAAVPGLLRVGRSQGLLTDHPITSAHPLLSIGRRRAGRRHVMAGRHRVTLESSPPTGAPAGRLLYQRELRACPATGAPAPHSCCARRGWCACFERVQCPTSVCRAVGNESGLSESTPRPPAQHPLSALHVGLRPIITLRYPARHPLSVLHVGLWPRGHRGFARARGRDVARLQRLLEIL